MLREWFQRWCDWTGDADLERAIRAELRRQGYAVRASLIRDVRLAAIQRPGWLQVFRFRVEAVLNEENPGPRPEDRREVLLHGLSRDDGRESRIEVLLTEDQAEWRSRLDEWSEGMIRRS